MPMNPHWRRTGPFALAILYAVVVTLYCALSLYASRQQVTVELGFENEYIPSEHCELVRSVTGGSPAEESGLRPGDRIVAINGQEIRSSFTLLNTWSRRAPGDTVLLSVMRPGVSGLIVLRATFRGRTAASNEGRLTQDLNRWVSDAYFLPFLVVGLAVLFLRMDDPNAWLLALMFGTFIAAPSLSDSLAILSPPLRLLATFYRATFVSLLGALFYFFFAVFPERSPLDRRLPWLKWVGLTVGIALAVPGWRSGDPGVPATALRWLGDRDADLVRFIYTYGFIGLGVISLVANAIGIAEPEARRKLRVIFWGTLVGVLPVAAQHAAADFLAVETPTLLGVGLALLLFLFPLAFAYAVVKHRVLELPVLLRRSARYLLVQRGFTILLAGLSVAATLVFAFSFAGYLGTRVQAALPVGIALGSGFGSFLLWTGRKVQQGVGRKIDRAFFRNAYDVRVILEDLAERIRRATDRRELAGLLEHQLSEALHPSTFAIYLESGDGRLSAAASLGSPGTRTVAASEPLLAAQAKQGRPWIVSDRSPADRAASDLFPALSPECLVPMLGRDGRLAGLLVLGLPLSEEPYSREDLRLLSAVANQAGLALESILLGEKIAERIAADRRVAQEMEFARQVQARLFPQKLPSLGTLDYLGHCLPARQVGGDYYDFLELNPGRVALVLADIAGKGVSGALLMANLQANLRSQYALALEDPRRLLDSVNHLFCQSTDESSYATLFFADYDDSTRRLRYINCGHLPPVLLRAGASPAAAVERLEPTCMVLGMFEEWESVVAEVQLAAGDLLVLYTDGVTEAVGGTGEEFGEARLVQILRASMRQSLPSLIETIVSSVESFRAGEQGDDVTLVVARCRG